MLLQRIREDEHLSQYLSNNCCENGICVSFDPAISEEDYVIIKVDDFYNSLNIAKRPASIDCLIIRRCLDGGYGLTLVELKNIRNADGFDLENMVQKFRTTIEDFIPEKFPVLHIDYKNVKLYFVSQQEIYKRDLGLKMEALIGTIIKFNGKRLLIKPKMPSPSILKCY